MVWTELRSHRHLVSLRVALVFVMSLLCSAAQGAAQGDEGVGRCLDIPECREELTKAQQLAKDEQYEQALKAFLGLYNKYADPRLCFSIGRMFYRQRQPAQALHYYQIYVDSNVETNSQQLARTALYIREAKALMAAQEAASALEAGPRPQESPSGAPPPVAPSSKRSFPIAGTVLGASTAVLIIVAGVTLGVGVSGYNNLSATCEPVCSDEQVQSVRQKFNASYAFWGLAAATAIATAITLPLEIRMLRRQKASAPAVAFSLAGSSVVLSGRF